MKFHLMAEDLFWGRVCQNKAMLVESKEVISMVQIIQRRIDTLMSSLTDLHSLRAGSPTVNNRYYTGTCLECIAYHSGYSLKITTPVAMPAPCSKHE